MPFALRKNVCPVPCLGTEIQLDAVDQSYSIETSIKYEPKIKYHADRSSEFRTQRS